MSVRGSCLCRSVEYEVSGPFDPIVNCHCSICRKAHGAAFGSFTGCKNEHFAWLQGKEQISLYESSPGFHRAFCAKCGGTVPFAHGKDAMIIPAGSLDGDPNVRATGHFYVGSKAPWYEIVDKLPQHQTWPED